MALNWLRFLLWPSKCQIVPINHHDNEDRVKPQQRIPALAVQQIYQIREEEDIEEEGGPRPLNVASLSIANVEIHASFAPHPPYSSSIPSSSSKQAHSPWSRRGGPSLKPHNNFHTQVLLNYYSVF